MIKLCTPYIGEEEIEGIKEVIQSKYLVQGESVQEFENKISKYLGAKHAIAVSSGTAALHLALLALDIKSGDEVIVPNFTFPATTNVVEIVGASVKLVDIKLDDFCIDEKLIEKYITKNTKVIMPVQEFGQSSNMDSILRIAKKYELKVIEDAACALGAKYNDKMVGTLGDIGCFSFHPRKAITTGEGGILVTNNDEIAKKVRVLLNHGINYEDGKIDFVMPGYNYRLTNIQGAIGVAQFDKMTLINDKKKELVKYYNELLKDDKRIILPKESDKCIHIWQTYHVLLDDNIDRDGVIRFLRDEGVEGNIGAYAVSEQSYYKNKYNVDNKEYKNSIYAYNHGLALPLHSEINEEDIREIVSKLKLAIDKNQI